MTGEQYAYAYDAGLDAGKSWAQENADAMALDDPARYMTQDSFDENVFPAVFGRLTEDAFLADVPAADISDACHEGIADAFREVRADELF